MTLEFREATPADGRFAADVLTARTPGNPRDPVLMSAWWAEVDPQWTNLRRLALLQGAPVGYFEVNWPRWEEGRERYGYLHAAAWPDHDDRLDELIAAAESAARSSGAEFVTFDCPEEDEALLAAFETRGWERRNRAFRSEIDLVGSAARLRSLADESRAKMASQGIALATVAERDDAFVDDLLAMANVAWEDIPRTGPYIPATIEEIRNWMSAPGNSTETWWTAVAEGKPIGLSVMGYPVERGFPHTDTTAVHPDWRGRGVALALKLATLLQAMERGFERARTENDTTNAPILHLNREVLGYQLVPGEQELRLKL